MNKADLILHPARAKIIQALAQKQLTIQELSDELPDLPKSSIYRHMRVLLKGSIVRVAGSRLVKGTPENLYEMAQPAHLNQEDLAAMTPADYQRYFAMFAATQLDEFAAYVHSAPQVNFEQDFAGFSQAIFWAGPEELLKLMQDLQALILPLAQNPPGGERRPHKMAIITHPFIKGEPNHD